MASSLPIPPTYEGTSEISLLVPNLRPDWAREPIKIRKQRPTAIGFVDLPGEIRNKIYHFALVTGGGPRNPTKQTPRDGGLDILQVSKAVYREAKSYFNNNAIAYLPVCTYNDAYLPQDRGRSIDTSCLSYHYTYREALATQQTTHLYVHSFFGLPTNETCAWYRRIDTLPKVLRDFVDFTRRYHTGLKRSLAINFTHAKFDPSRLAEFLTAIGNDESIDVELTLWWGPFDFKEHPILKRFTEKRTQMMNARLAEHNLKMYVTRLEEGARGQYVRGDVVRLGQRVFEVDARMKEELAKRNSEWDIDMRLTPDQTVRTRPDFPA